jgi:hypothetical protein
MPDVTPNCLFPTKCHTGSHSRVWTNTRKTRIIEKISIPSELCCRLCTGLLLMTDVPSNCYFLRNATRGVTKRGISSISRKARSIDPIRTLLQVVYAAVAHGRRHVKLHVPCTSPQTPIIRNPPVCKAA